jgi:hypothetical protein
VSGPDDHPVERDEEYRREVTAELNVHIFSVSAAMVGVCLTVVGIIGIIISNNSEYATVADDLLAVDTVVFMFSCLLAYTSLRSTSVARTRSYQRLADGVFVTGMVTMSIACLIIAFSIV